VLANIATALHTTSDFLLGIKNEEFDHPLAQKLWDAETEMEWVDV
jgi:hypothetical protein